MKKRLLRLLGKGIAILGIPVFVLSSYGVYAALSYTGVYGPLPQEVAYVLLIALLGLIMIAGGTFLLKRNEEPALLLSKGGEPIHFGEIWKKGTELGLFLTLCGRVVSINQQSSATAHTGYRIASAKGATCKDCMISMGRHIIETGGTRREGA